jgi:hypothetical protein
MTQNEKSTQEQLFHDPESCKCLHAGAPGRVMTTQLQVKLLRRMALHSESLTEAVASLKTEYPRNLVQAAADSNWSGLLDVIAAATRNYPSFYDKLAAAVTEAYVEEEVQFEIDS